MPLRQLPPIIAPRLLANLKPINILARNYMNRISNPVFGSDIAACGRRAKVCC